MRNPKRKLCGRAQMNNFQEKNINSQKHLNDCSISLWPKSIKWHYLGAFKFAKVGWRKGNTQTAKCQYKCVQFNRIIW